MKNVGVMVNALNDDYNNEALNGIIEYFKNTDVNVIIMPTKTPIDKNNENQYWALSKLSDCNLLDGIIIVSGGYITDMEEKDLVKSLNFLKGKPVISLSVSLPFKFDSYCTTVSIQDAYDDVVGHCKNVHKCKRIAFLSSSYTHSREAKSRFEAYKNALEKHGYPFEKSLIFQSDFSYHHTLKYLKDIFTCPEDVDFDACLCANDRMAAAMIEVLKKAGVKVPEDVKVFGYDNSAMAIANNPSISSINHNLSYQGKMCAELMHKVFSGRIIPKVTDYQVQPIYRKSCGCCPNEPDNEPFTYDVLTNSLYNNSDIMKIYLLLSQLQTKQSRKFFADAVDTSLAAVTENITAISVVLFDDPVDATNITEFEYPSHARQVIYLDAENPSANSVVDIEINPITEFTASPILKGQKSGNFIVHPIYNGNYQYGYLVAREKADNHVMNLVLLKIIANVFVNSFDLSDAELKNRNLSTKNTQLAKEKKLLTKQSNTDEMTGFLNRRGFLEIGQQTVNNSLELGVSGCLFFGDMNGLKTINDTLGHDAGDAAILAQAEVLKNAFRSSDVIGRLGGDEFVIIAVGASIDQLDTFRLEVEKLCKEISLERNLPKTISISLGGVPYDSENCDLKTLLASADKALYTQKRKFYSRK